MKLKQLIKYDNAPAIEATWVDDNDVVIKCQAYSHHPEQMAMLRADLGSDAAQYEEMIAEVEATYVPPEPQPIPVPQQITRAQGKAALIMQGLWGAVLDYVASIQDPTQRALAEVALNDTLTWERSSPFLNVAAGGMGMTDEQLDALFIRAAGIAL
jgi:hypothetical protein